MKITREMLIDKVSQKDVDYFVELYYGDYENRDLNQEFKIVYDMNYGDGNDYFVTLYFPNHDLYVSLEGMYSSWDSAQWDKVMFAEPFQYTETRYKEITLEYIRDKKIETIVKDSE